MIHTKSLKKLTAINDGLSPQMNQLLMDGTHPDRLSQGRTVRTVLIMKEPQKGAVPSNYPPTTCLCATWKLLPGFIADTSLETG